MPAPAAVALPAAALRPPLPLPRLARAPRRLLAALVSGSWSAGRSAVFASAAVPAHLADQGLLFGRPARDARRDRSAGGPAGEPARQLLDVVAAQPRRIPRDGDTTVPLLAERPRRPHVAGTWRGRPLPVSRSSPVRIRGAPAHRQQAPRAPREGDLAPLGAGRGPPGRTPTPEAALPRARHPRLLQPGTRRVRAGPPGRTQPDAFRVVRAAGGGRTRATLSGGCCHRV